MLILLLETGCGLVFFPVLSHGLQTKVASTGFQSTVGGLDTAWPCILGVSNKTHSFLTPFPASRAFTEVEECF